MSHCPIFKALEQNLIHVRTLQTIFVMRHGGSEVELQRFWDAEDVARERLLDHRAEHACTPVGR
jgi:hypothetical protein